MRAMLTTAVMSLLLLSAVTAQSQGLGGRGDLTFAADRLFGFYVGERKVELPNGVDVDLDIGLFAVGWGSETTPLNRPRLAIDYFVIDQVSVGGALGFYGIDDQDPDDNNDGFGFLLAPRVGYLLSFGRVAGFWPRGGFTFYSIDDDPVDQRQFAINLEGIFVLAPREHFAFEVGPTIDLGVAGELGPRDMREWSLGIAIGLLGWVDL